MASRKGKKQANKLNRRRADYSAMIAQSNKDWSGYHRPGSNKK